MKYLLLILVFPLIACTSSKDIKALKNIKIQKDIFFTDAKDEKQALDVYSPKMLTKKAPVLIHIHGGGWRMGDKHRMDKHGKHFANHGIICVTPNYRLSPRHKHPAHVEDCAAAVAWVIKSLDLLKGDKNRIYLSGHSAGAHLAALLATNEKYLAKYKLKVDLFKAVIPVDSASYDLTTDGKERLVNFFVRSAFGKKPETLKDASPTLNVNAKKQYSPFHVFVTTNRDVAVREAVSITTKLAKLNPETSLHKIDGLSHTEMSTAMYDLNSKVGKT